MSDLTFSDIDFKNKMVWVWTTLNPKFLYEIISSDNRIMIFIFSDFSWLFLRIILYFSIFNFSLSERKPLCPVWSDDVSSSCLSRKVFRGKSIFLAPGHLNAWIIGDLRGTVHFRRLPQLYRKRDFLPIFNLTSIP